MKIVVEPRSSFIAAKILASVSEFEIKSALENPNADATIIII